MADEPGRLPPWVTWQQRPFPDANLLLLPGRNPALVDIRRPLSWVWRQGTARCYHPARKPSDPRIAGLLGPSRPGTTVR